MAGATDSVVRGDQKEALLRRIGLAASKYWVCKRATPHAAEALECLGGNGYVEESGMPRLYREAPLMGIWEGSGNVSALDTLRAMATRPECVEVLFAELAASAGSDARLDSHVENLRPQLADLDTIQYRARKVAEDICWCGTDTPRWPKRSWPRGWTGGGAVRSVPCQPGWTSVPSSNGPW
jgi:putative acyl-CoA dehydrogenase